MVNMTRLEVERIIDFLIFKDKLINFRYVVLYNKIHHNEVLKMINDEDTNISRDVDENIGIYLNITRLFTLKVIFLQNHFNVENISHDLLQVIISHIPLEIDKTFNQLIIQYERDNIRITHSYHYHNKTKAIKRRKMLNFEKSCIENPYKFILKCKVEGYELYNNANIEIDFELFRELFFKLPFISDLLRANTSLLYSFNEDSLTVLLPFVKIALISPSYDSIFCFVFSKDYVRKKILYRKWMITRIE